MLAWFESHPRLADAAIAVLAFALFGAADFVRDGVPGMLIDIVFALSLAFWRRMPGLGLAIAWVGALVQIGTVDGLILGDILILGAVFATGLTEQRFVRWAGLASSVVGGAVAGARLVLFAPKTSDSALLPTDPFYRGVYFVLVSAVIAAALALFWALGVLVRNRRAAAGQRLGRLHDRIMAEATLAEERERALLSREMHDLIGHALAVVIAQSDGARYAKAADPEAETRALETIGRTARAALDDVHELLSVLREPRDPAARPALGAAGLGVMVASVRDAGLAVTVTETGSRVALSAAHELALFRVLQESLTNAIKHGGHGSAVDLRLDWQASAVHFDVLTDEPGTGTRSLIGTSGQGLIGMTERMRLLGGGVETGPRTDVSRGFRVRGYLPYSSASPLQHLPTQPRTPFPSESSR
ncbi:MULTISPECIES: sensor histidine kinase [Subtercola]|uniref:histidine kinase n=1 Tax=Subtercola vilae TaxID=2056433 RepID=A0A4T2C6Q6_9MICO|nr:MULTISPECIES: histidine kinase [Subtercola]MEA9985476.1 histidine kinase [Subtercola sp. RTI3]TIH39302.1 hypothetical protein D4765_04280 [Subtercola vilae]